VTDSAPILRLPEELLFRAGEHLAALGPLELRAGDWVAIAPETPDPPPEGGTALARLLATLGAPAGGSIELFGGPPHARDYMDLLRLRARLGFVPGQGGLLSNRTLRDNIALPLSVHGKLSHAQEDARVAELVARFDLARAARLRPHEVDGPTRFRACVARALALDPEWLVVEGIGAFEAETPGSIAWQRLLEYRSGRPCAAAVCLARPRPAFERWLADHGGRVVRYRLLQDSERTTGS